MESATSRQRFRVGFPVLFVCLFVFKSVIPTMDDCPIEPSLYLTDSSSSFHELVEHIHVKEYSFSALPRSSICVSSLFKLLTSKFRSYGCCTIISFNSYAIHFKVLLPSKSKDQFRLKWACMRPKEWLDPIQNQHLVRWVFDMCRRPVDFQLQPMADTHWCFGVYTYIIIYIYYIYV